MTSLLKRGRNKNKNKGPKKTPSYLPTAGLVFNEDAAYKIYQSGNYQTTDPKKENYFTERQIKTLHDRMIKEMKESGQIQAIKFDLGGDEGEEGGAGSTSIIAPNAGGDDDEDEEPYEDTQEGNDDGGDDEEGQVGGDDSGAAGSSGSDKKKKNMAMLRYKESELVVTRFPPREIHPTSLGAIQKFLDDNRDLIGFFYSLSLAKSAENLNQDKRMRCAQYVYKLITFGIGSYGRIKLYATPKYTKKIPAVKGVFSATFQEFLRYVALKYKYSSIGTFGPTRNPGNRTQYQMENIIDDMKEKRANEAKYKENERDSRRRFGNAARGFIKHKRVNKAIFDPMSLRDVKGASGEVVRLPEWFQMERTMFNMKVADGGKSTWYNAIKDDTVEDHIFYQYCVAGGADPEKIKARVAERKEMIVNEIPAGTLSGGGWTRGDRLSFRTAFQSMSKCIITEAVLAAYGFNRDDIQQIFEDVESIEEFLSGDECKIYYDLLYNESQSQDLLDRQNAVKRGANENDLFRPMGVFSKMGQIRAIQAVICGALANNRFPPRDLVAIDKLVQFEHDEMGLSFDDDFAQAMAKRASTYAESRFIKSVSEAHPWTYIGDTSGNIGKDLFETIDTGSRAGSTPKLPLTMDCKKVFEIMDEMPKRFKDRDVTQIAVIDELYDWIETKQAGDRGHVEPDEPLISPFYDPSQSFKAYPYSWDGQNEMDTIYIGAFDDDKPIEASNDDFLSRGVLDLDKYDKEHPDPKVLDEFFYEGSDDESDKDEEEYEEGEEED